MSELIESIERRQLRRELPAFRVGDRVRVHFQVVEGTRRRTQVFEGVVIRLQGAGSRRTFTVRKLSFGVGVERTFPLHTPKIERMEIVGRGEVRRAKLYYLRGRVGRKARLRERRDFRPEEVVAPAAQVPPPDEVEEPGDGAPTEQPAPEAVDGAQDDGEAAGQDATAVEGDAEAGQGEAEVGDDLPGEEAGAPEPAAAGSDEQTAEVREES